MINHARTVILNQRGTTVELGVFGADFVDPKYLPYTRDQVLGNIWSAFFGNAGDALYTNQVMRLLMTCSHGCPDVDKYFRGLDSRITYVYADKPILAKSSVTVQPLTASPTQLALVGDVTPSYDAGRAFFSYNVNFGQYDTVVTDYETGRSDTYPSAEVGKLLSCGALPMFLGTAPGAWDVLVSTRTDWGLQNLFDRLQAKSTDVEKLLREGSPRWLELYRKGHGIVHRLAAVLAAFVERAEKIRNG